MSGKTYISPEPSRDILDEGVRKPVRPLPDGYVIRPLQAGAELSELNWVRKAWKLGNRRFKKNIHAKTYAVGMDKLIGHLGLTQKMLVAALPTDIRGRDEILGFICYRQLAPEDPALVVHYLCVKGEYRRNGLALQLLSAAGWRPGMPIVGTAQSHLPSSVRRKWNVFFNDFFLYAGCG